MQRADSTRAAMTDKDGYSDWLRAKERLSRPIREPEVVVILPKNEEWFKANGIPYRLLEEPTDL